MRVFVLVGLGDADESRGSAVNRDKQHLFTAPLQPFGPVTQAVDRNPEVSKQRRGSKYHRVPGNSPGNTSRGRMLELFDWAYLYLALASALDDGCSDGCIKTPGETRGKGEK